MRHQGSPEVLHYKYGKERNEIITLINGFHGRTITTLAATGQDIFHKDFFPFTPGFLYTPANDLPSFIKLCKEHPQVCAVMVEPIQGEGGVHPLSKEFSKASANMPKTMISFSSWMKCRPVTAAPESFTAI